MLSDQPYTFDRVIRIAITVGLVWGFITTLSYLSDVLIPFAVALILAYLINPMVSWIQRKNPLKARTPAVLLSLLVIILAMTLVGIIIIPLILAELSHMQKLLAEVVDTDTIKNKIFYFVPEEVWAYIKDFFSSDELIQLLNLENIKTVSQQVLPGIWGVFSGTISFMIGLMGIIIVIMYLIFILMDFEEVSEGWKALIPPQYKSRVIDVLEDFTDAMQRYFRGQALIAAIVGVLFALGFWIIGLPLGIILGIFIGVLNMVPYLQIIGLVPAVLFGVISSLETGQSPWVVILLVLIVFIVVQLIQDALLVPKIMGNVTGFNPAVILLSLSVWGKLLGILGLIIALPVTFLIHSYYKRLISPARQQKVET